MRRSAGIYTIAVALTALVLVRCSEDRTAVTDPASSDATDATDATDAKADPEPAIDAGARVKCAEHSPAPRCLGCAADEDCFTQVSCGLLPEGGSACNAPSTPSDAAAGDDSCHRRCEYDSECPAGERCIHLHYFGCHDFNGSPKGKGLCCRGSDGCP